MAAPPHQIFPKNIQHVSGLEVRFESVSGLVSVSLELRVCREIPAESGAAVIPESPPRPVGNDAENLKARAARCALGPSVRLAAVVIIMMIIPFRRRLGLCVRPSASSACLFSGAHTRGSQAGIGLR